MSDSVKEIRLDAYCCMTSAAALCLLERMPCNSAWKPSGVMTAPQATFRKVELRSWRIATISAKIGVMVSPLAAASNTSRHHSLSAFPSDRAASSNSSCSAFVTLALAT